jgi:peptidoglycan/LPS O-acetylase OafA/YrhL
MNLPPTAQSTPKPVAVDEIKKFDFIDALRGWAFLGVLAIHAGEGFARLSGWTELGAMGVQLFFVASAVTLCLSWNQRAGRDQQPVRDFLIRRFFRIAPLFWCGIAAYLLMPGRDGVVPKEWLGTPHVLLTALFAHGWHPETINSVVPGGWSIAAEFAFYALFPFLVGQCRTWQSTCRWLGLSLVISLVANSVLLPLLKQTLFAKFSSEQMWAYSHFWFPGQLPVFLVGILAYHAMVRFDSGKPNPSSGWTLIVASLVLLVALKDFNLSRLLPKHVAYAFAFGLLLLGLAQYPARLFVNVFMCRLGQLSFSAYLVHFAALFAVRRAVMGTPIWSRMPLGDLGRFALLATGGLVLTYAVSSLTHRWIEKPGIQLGKRLIRKLETRTVLNPS